MKSLSRLNRNLLLLARIDNSQYGQKETIEVAGFVRGLMPSLRSISGNTPVHEIYDNTGLSVKANRTLFESLVNNLAANAVRHNRPGGEISVSVSGRQFTISNTSDGQELDKSQIFNRFYRPSENSPGNGLGLAIVKAICEYHGWSVDYRHSDGQHHFTVTF